VIHRHLAWLLPVAIATMLPSLAWAQDATVEIISFTEGASVTIDDQEVGVTPLMDPLPITEGTHVIRVVKRGYLPWEETVDVVAGDELYYEADPFPFAGIVRIDSGHPGDEVWVDNQQTGNTPFDEEVTMGVHTFSVRRPQHEEWSVTENIAAGIEYDYPVTLMPLSEMGTEIVVTETTPWYREWWFWSGVAVVVGAGVATTVLLTQENVVSDANIIIQLP
jgi:hypothetical protein